MIRDIQAMYSDAQAITAIGNTDSANIINQLAQGDAYDPLALRIQVGTAFTSGGAGTLGVNLLTADDLAFSANLVTYPIVGTTALTSLTAGAILFNGYLPIGMKQYHKLQYVVGTAAMTAGTVNAALVEDVPTNRM